MEPSATSVMLSVLLELILRKLQPEPTVGGNDKVSPATWLVLLWQIIFILKLFTVSCASWWWRCQFLNILSAAALYFPESQWFGKWNIRETNLVYSLVLIGLELTRQPTISNFFLFILIRKRSYENMSLSIYWTYFPQISFIYLLLMPPLNGEGLMETNDLREGEMPWRSVS